MTVTRMMPLVPSGILKPEFGEWLTYEAEDLRYTYIRNTRSDRTGGDALKGQPVHRSDAPREVGKYSRKEKNMKPSCKCRYTDCQVEDEICIESV